MGLSRRPTEITNLHNRREFVRPMAEAIAYRVPHSDDLLQCSRETVALIKVHCARQIGCIFFPGTALPPRPALTDSKCFSTFQILPDVQRLRHCVSCGWHRHCGNSRFARVRSTCSGRETPGDDQRNACGRRRVFDNVRRSGHGGCRHLVDGQSALDSEGALSRLCWDCLSGSSRPRRQIFIPVNLSWLAQRGNNVFIGSIIVVALGHCPRSTGDSTA